MCRAIPPRRHIYSWARGTSSWRYTYTINTRAVLLFCLYHLVFSCVWRWDGAYEFSSKFQNF